MQAHDVEAQFAPITPTGEGASGAPLGETFLQLREIPGPAGATARGMLEAEEALRLVRQRSEHTEDPEVRGELAAEALDHVERQLQLTRERRWQLDGTEAKLWATQNRLEEFLIRTRGSAWWRARRAAARMKAAATD
jgi:hypothetical protein